MSERIYQFTGIPFRECPSGVRWISVEELDLFNKHLSLCAQTPLEPDEWKKIYEAGTMYCLLMDNGLPAARACVEKYSDNAWEIADVRVVQTERGRGFAYSVCLYVLQYILNSGKKATIRTKPHNAPMLRVMEKLGFTPLE